MRINVIAENEHTAQGKHLRTDFNDIATISVPAQTSTIIIFSTTIQYG